MNEQQFALFMEKLDWIGYELEKLNEQTRVQGDYPRDVRVVDHSSRSFG